MSHRIIFVNPTESNLRGKYVVGSGVGSRNRSVQKALQRRASNNSQGKPCCTNENNNCRTINVSDIANTTDGGITFDLNADTTILECQTLLINITLFIPNNKKLINYGNIIITDELNITGNIDNYGTINNNGLFDVNLFDGISGIFNNKESGIFNNKQDIENEGYINNKGRINNNGGTITNTGGTITNTGGTITNTGGTIYNYNTGIIDNTGGTINNTGGTLNNANGTGGCGTSTYNGTLPIGGIIGTACPPP